MKPQSPVVPGYDLSEIVYAKDQPEYSPLPCLKSNDSSGLVTCRFHFTWKERFKLFFFGDMWIQLLTFHKPLQPIKLFVNKPKIEELL